MNNETGLDCIVICTADNYSRLMQVTDKTSVYIGYSRVDYNNSAKHNIAEQSWELLNKLQHNLRDKAIEEVEEAVVKDDILTGLEEIFQKSIDYQEFSQPEIIINVYLN